LHIFQKEPLSNSKGTGGDGKLVPKNKVPVKDGRVAHRDQGDVVAALKATTAL